MRTVERKLKKTHGGNSVAVQTVQLDEDEVEGLIYMMALITAIRDRNEDLKGSVFYSKKIEAVLDEFSNTKLRKIFQGELGRGMSDRVMHAEQVFSQFCKHMIKLVDQPESVQIRFNNTVLDAFVTAGVIVEDYNPIKL